MPLPSNAAVLAIVPPVSSSGISGISGISRLDDYLCSIGNSAPDLVHFSIRYRHATVCPIYCQVQPTYPTQSIPYTVDHHETARIDAAGASSSHVGGVRVGDMQRSVKCAVAVAVVESVLPLWRSPIALPLFRANRMSTKGYSIRREQRTVFIEL